MLHKEGRKFEEGRKQTEAGLLKVLFPGESSCLAVGRTRVGGWLGSYNNSTALVGALVYE